MATSSTCDQRREITAHTSPSCRATCGRGASGRRSRSSRCARPGRLAHYRVHHCPGAAHARHTHRLAWREIAEQRHERPRALAEVDGFVACTATTGAAAHERLTHVDLPTPASPVSSMCTRLGLQLRRYEVVAVLVRAYTLASSLSLLLSQSLSLLPRVPVGGNSVSMTSHNAWNSAVDPDTRATCCPAGRRPWQGTQLHGTVRTVCAYCIHVRMHV